jgi:ABC-type bacteriocin/lantibiotic exporter with double-glycine peptidase domain
MMTDMLVVAPISIPVPDVPFYSQFVDITSHEWQKKSCGIASLAMLINYYKPKAIGINDLLIKAISSGAYDPNAGWIHNKLISLSTKYGLDGKTYDFSASSNASALASITTLLKDGPVMASVHYKFDPKSTIPHLVVIDAVRGDVVYYNDPAANMGKKQISSVDFMKGWKKRLIVIRPVKSIQVSTPKISTALSVIPQTHYQMCYA